MSSPATTNARIDVMALAVQCIAASLPSVQAREVAAAFSDGLSQLLIERGQMSIEQDEVVAVQAGQFLRALSR